MTSQLKETVQHFVIFVALIILLAISITLLEDRIKGKKAAQEQEMEELSRVN